MVVVVVWGVGGRGGELYKVLSRGVLGHSSQENIRSSEIKFDGI